MVGLELLCEMLEETAATSEQHRGGGGAEGVGHQFQALQYF